MFLPGLLAENRDGHGSLPRSRNLLSEKGLTRPSTLYGRGRADIHHGPESVTPLEAEYIGADQLPLLVFRLQLCGGPYIPISGTYQELAPLIDGSDCDGEAGGGRRSTSTSRQNLAIRAGVCFSGRFVWSRARKGVGRVRG